MGRVREEKRRRKKIREEKVPVFCGSRGSKSRLAKAAGAEPSRQMRDQKLHLAVALSRFGSQNVKSAPVSERFGS